MNEERIDELLSIWQRASDAGQDVSAEELCREHPELKAEVSRQIELLKRSSQDRTDRINSEPDLSDSATRFDDGSAVVRKKPGSALHPGDVLGNYRIISKLGQGGMGQVFKAEHLRMQRIVALKVLPPTLSWDKGVIARFQREVHAAAKLSHPNIVTAFDADEANGQHYLVMEYVEGNDLAEIVRKQGPFDLLTAVDCIIQAARGLEYAHRRGVIHRDIKPSNLLFAPSDRHESDSSAEGVPSSGHVIKILDMGLARLDSAEGTATADLTNTGTVMGTVDYMSPEQALDTRQANAQSDIYSLGCTRWYLLGGRSVYEGDTVMKRLVAHREHAVPSLRTKLVEDSQRRSELTGLDAQLTSLDAVFQKMVAKKPSDRYASMTDVIRSLQSIEQSLKALNIQSSVDFVPSGETRQLSLASSDSMANSDISSPTMIVSQQAVIAPESPKLHTQIGTGKGQRSTPQKRRLRSLLGLVGLAVMLLLGVIIIKIKKPDGTVTEVKVPEGTEVDLSSIPKGSKVEILPDTGAKMPQVTKGNIPDAPKVAVGFDPAAERKAAEWIVKFGDCVLFNEKDQFLATQNTGSPVLPQGTFYVREAILSGVDDVGLKTLAGCRRLQSLRFGANCGKVSAAGLQALSECRTLKKLALSQTSVGAGLGDLLMSWPQLEELNLQTLPLSDDVLGAFPDCPSLKILDIGMSTTITDVGLTSVVTHCPALEQLNVYGHPETQQTLLPLGMLKQLRELTCSGHQFSDDSVKALKALPSLDHIHLGYPDTNQALSKLLTFAPKLRSLTLSAYADKSHLSDADFRAIRQYRGLQEVVLVGQLRVTDTALLELAEMTDLKKLHLSQIQVPAGGAAPYSAEGIAKFRERRPDVHLIDGNHDYPAS